MRSNVRNPLRQERNTSPNVFSLPIGVEQEFYLFHQLDLSSGQPRPGHYYNFVQHQGLVSEVPLEKETTPWQVEVGVGIDATPQDVAENLSKRKEAMRIVSEASRLVPVGVSMFPTLNTLEAPAYDGDSSFRYRHLRANYGDYTANCTCGLHIHIGLEAFIQANWRRLRRIFREPLRQIRWEYNERHDEIQGLLRRMEERGDEQIPFILSGSRKDLLTFILQDWLVREMNNHAWVFQVLSSSSPFVNGRDGGRINERLRDMQRMAVHGLMSYPDVGSHFVAIVDMMVRGLILNTKEEWWSIRCHPFLPTVENRLCDIPLSDDDTVALAALNQALVSWLLRGLLERGSYGFVRLSHRLNERNLVETAIHGLDGNVVDALARRKQSVPVQEAIQRLLEHLRREAELLGSSNYLDHIRDEICVRGSSSYLMRAWYEESGGSLEMVARRLIKTAERGLNGLAPDWEPARRYRERNRRG